ncbi:MAG: hypothetical protein WBA57_12755 [Elainellaceae cyanobacterium]
MIYSAVFLFCLILAPLLASLRGWKPASLFFVVAVVYGVCGAVSFAQIQFSLSQTQEVAPAYNDTYLVVSSFYLLLNIGIAMAIFGGITWAQTRLGAMRYPTLTKIIFWILHITVMGTTAFQGVFAFILSKPPKIFDPLEFIESYMLINAWAGVLSQAALLGFFCLLLWSAAAKLLRKQGYLRK